MAAQKPSKAQQEVLDAMAAGATLEYDTVTNSYYWGGENWHDRTPANRTLAVLFARRWIKALSRTNRVIVFGLANSD